MKKRLLSLLMCGALVFTGLAPVMAEEPITESAAAEPQAASGYTESSDDVPMVGFSQLTRSAASEKLKNYLRGNGEVDEKGTYYISWQDFSGEADTFWQVAYLPSSNTFMFYQTTWTYGENLTMVGRNWVSLPYGREDEVYSRYTLKGKENEVTYADGYFAFSNPAGYTGTEQLTINFGTLNPAAGSTTAEMSERANASLQAAFKKWNDWLLIYPHVAMTTLGFDAYKYTHTHEYGKKIIKQAGIGTDGEYQNICVACSNIKSTKVVRAVSSVELNKDTFDYNGKVQKPSVTVKNSAGKTVSSKYYDLKYSNRASTEVGKYTVQVVFKDLYTGTKTLSYTIEDSSSGTLSQPKLIGAYNSENGIGVKFNRVNAATKYVIYRKHNGTWIRIRTISATSSRLKFSGKTVMYIDTTVKDNYGKGYIYSVAAKKGSKVSKYNKKGVAIFRLIPPANLDAVSSEGEALVTWDRTAGHGYELQYADVDGDGEWIKCPQTTDTAQRVTGLTPGKRYAFRVRSFKKNASRGTSYSEYSSYVFLDM